MVSYGILEKMIEVHLEYVIDRVTKKGNGEVEILAIGYTSEDAVKAVSSEMDIIMKQVPPEIKQMIEQQFKMFGKQTKPMIKFIVSEEEYADGSWRVGNTIDIIIRERKKKE